MIVHRELSIVRNQEPQEVQRDGRTDTQDLALGTAETDICDDLWNPDPSQERAVWVIAMDSINALVQMRPAESTLKPANAPAVHVANMSPPRQLAIGTDTKYAYVARTVLHMASPRLLCVRRQVIWCHASRLELETRVMGTLMSEGLSRLAIHGGFALCGFPRRRSAPPRKAI
jgi:hypothetical protein